MEHCTTSNEIVRALLSQGEPWRRWNDYLRSQMAVHEGPISGSATARVLKSFLSLSDTDSPYQRLKRICRFFTISKPERFTSPGQGDVTVDKETVDLFGPKYKITLRLGKAPTTRRLSVFSHEIGHIFYPFAKALTNEGDISQEPEEAKDIEDFCWAFGLELSCAKNLRTKWKRAFLISLLSPSERQILESMDVAASLCVPNYWHLSALARYLRVSIRMAICALDRQPILNECQTGLAVHRKMHNPATGREISLRILGYARPTWGHVIKNQRAVRQGFESVAHVYDHGVSQSIYPATETLCLWQRPSDGPGRWKKIELKTECFYTPVDVKQEGRYVLAVWRWPRPEKQARRELISNSEAGSQSE